jgi:mRNA-degrading endonuclease RelE of RelBE toxin-antitoxin system
LENELAYSIKKLKGKTGEYRLRVGDWRVRFRVDFINRTYLITHVKT